MNKLQYIFKWILGIVFFFVGGFFLIPPINNYINDKFNHLKIVDKSKDWQRFLIVFVLIIVIMPNNANVQKQSKIVQDKPIQTDVVKEKNPERLINASPDLINNMKAVLNDNYEIIDENKVYYIKSNDYKNAYFIGTLIKHINKIENCIWFSNSETMSGMTDSANDGAISASSMPDSRKSDVGVSHFDDGYSILNMQLLEDWNKIGK